MKGTVRQMLEEGRFDRIRELAGDSKQILRVLMGLTFDTDPLVAWHAVEAMGLAAAHIAEDDPDHVRDQLRRLHWLLMEESGGICWRAPEAMAEIVSRRPDLFADYLPIVTHLIMETAEEDLRHFRPGMLWAIGRLGPLATQDRTVAPAIVSALVHPESQVRGLAVWSLGRLGWRELLQERAELESDTEPVDLFVDGTLRRTTVADLLAAALDEHPAS